MFLVYCVIFFLSREFTKAINSMRFSHKLIVAFFF